MKYGKLKDVTGKTVRDWYEWLLKEQEGCCSVCYEADGEYRYCVCMGWTKEFGGGWKIAWKIGRQTHDNIMQCDLDIDFDMPYDEETGDVDDTEKLVTAVKTAREWNVLATDMRKTARRVWKDWRVKENAE